MDAYTVKKNKTLLDFFQVKPTKDLALFYSLIISFPNAAISKSTIVRRNAISSKEKQKKIRNGKENDSIWDV